VLASLCWGWIDGQRRSYDGVSFLQRVTPRRANSLWSKVNRDKVARLIAAGRMQTAGLLHVEQAQADGRWDAAYDSVAGMTVPAELENALAANPVAAAFFASLSKSDRYSMCWRIQTAKRPETRAKHVGRFVEMLERGETLGGQGA